MPKIAGNDTYYQEIQEVMTRLNLPMRDAELIMLKDVIIRMRMQEKKNWSEVAKHLHDVWGLSEGALQTRVKWVRERYVCP